MDEAKFQEVIRFAIEKEIGSFNLYTTCGRIAKYSGAKDLFTNQAGNNDGLTSGINKQARTKTHQHYPLFL